MSATVKDVTSLPMPATTRSENEGIVKQSQGGRAYTGFVAGVFSGIAKLSVGYVAIEPEAITTFH